jgi:hypothetical protein
MRADLVGDRDWVNLDLASVKEDRLIFIVEYLTNDDFTRSWTNDQISVSGNIAGTATTTHLRRGSVLGRSAHTRAVHLALRTCRGSDQPRTPCSAIPETPAGLALSRERETERRSWSEQYVCGFCSGAS